jgi:hypothetical protein
MLLMPMAVIKQFTRIFEAKIISKSLLKYKRLSKEVKKSLLKKSQRAVTVTHICQLFTDQNFIKSVTKL